MAAAREPGRLRIGVSTLAPIDAPLDPICERAVRDAAELLATLGHEVEDFEAPWRTDDALRPFTAVFGTPIDITLSELAVEAFFPADGATANALRNP